MKTTKSRGAKTEVADFLNRFEYGQLREDCFYLTKLMTEITGLPGQMWGHSTIGFGYTRYNYQTEREEQVLLTGFSPGRRGLSIFLPSGLDRDQLLLKALGRHRVGRAAIFVKSLVNIDRGMLKTLIRQSVDDMNEVIHQKSHLKNM